MLFVLNNKGQTPLDIIIEEETGTFDDISENEQEEFREGQETTHLDALKAGSGSSQSASRFAGGKVADESQLGKLVDPEAGRVGINRGMTQSKYNDILFKTKSLMDLMKKYHSQCSIRFLKEPNHLDRKFERSFTMAIKQNKTALMQHFPKNTISTSYVSMNQLGDIREFTREKRSRKEEMITTPLHLACQTSNLEAARILLMDHSYDVNILLHDKNFIYDLLNTASWEDFSILSNCFKRR